MNNKYKVLGYNVLTKEMKEFISKIQSDRACHINSISFETIEKEYKMEVR